MSKLGLGRTPEEKKSPNKRQPTVTLAEAIKANDEKTVAAHIRTAESPKGTIALSLFAATKAGHAKLVKMLINKGGADVNASLGGPTTKEVSPLQLAAAEGHLDIVRLLIGKGAGIDQCGLRYGTALSAAASGGHLDVVRCLLKKGASVHIKGGRYGYPLHAAAWGGNPDVVRCLLRAGADVNAVGGGHCTAVQMATFNEKSEALDVLLEAAGTDNGKPDMDDYKIVIMGGRRVGKTSIQEMVSTYLPLTNFRHTLAYS